MTAALHHRHQQADKRMMREYLACVSAVDRNIIRQKGKALVSQ